MNANRRNALFLVSFIAGFASAASDLSSMPRSVTILQHRLNPPYFLLIVGASGSTLSTSIPTSTPGSVGSSGGDQRAKKIKWPVTPVCQTVQLLFRPEACIHSGLSSTFSFVAQHCRVVITYFTLLFCCCIIFAMWVSRFSNNRIAVRCPYWISYLSRLHSNYNSNYNNSNCCSAQQRHRAAARLLLRQSDPSIRVLAHLQQLLADISVPLHQA